ncbi:mitochondrial DNA polymerase I protein B [Perkinsela sp. CCAP 1560/4]|nr:mitochondrial DNA polymerase I protein B [Perkinsela sp. CCAP 1560/4]|eukprot:KNH07483.1 mitochondrial DNA polymerase I protein B [Perkinsela sp. CCAP 1560/4]
MHDTLSKFSKHWLVSNNSSLWRNALRCFSKYANVFTVTPSRTDGCLSLKAFPHCRLDSEGDSLPPFETLSIRWPFTVDSCGPLQWMQNIVKQNARFMDTSEKNLPNVIFVLGWESYPRSFAVLAERHLVRPQKGDPSSFSIHYIHESTEGATHLSQLKRLTRDSLDRPKHFSLYALRATRRSKQMQLEETSDSKLNFTYVAASCELDIDKSEFDLIPLNQTPAEDDKIGLSAQKVLEYVSGKAEELKADERVLLVTNLHPRASAVIFRLASSTNHPKALFTSMQSVKNIFTDAGQDLFRQMAESKQSSAHINKLYNTATQFELSVAKSTLNKKAIQVSHGQTPPSSRVVCYFSKDSLTLLHIHDGGLESRATVRVANLPEKDFQAFLSAANPSMLIFWDAATAIKKLAKVLSPHSLRQAMQGVQLWCLSYAELLIHAPQGMDFRVSTVKEKLDSYGRGIDNARVCDEKGTFSTIPCETLTGIRMNEYFLVQWNESISIPNAPQKVQQWVAAMHCDRRPPRPHFQQNITKFYNSLLRGYVPTAVPLDFQNSWNWHSPPHIVPFFFGGKVKLGSGGHREQAATSRVKSDVIVELAQNAGALSKVGETHLRQYARRRQIGLSKAFDLQHAVRSKIDCLGPLHTYQALVYDIEATGLDIHQDRIVEFAIWDPVSNRTYETFVNPEISIPPTVTRIHGISDEDVVSAPTFAGAAQGIVSFLNTIRKSDQTELLLIAHNSKKFDQHILRRQFREVNVAFPSFAHCVDSLPVLFHCKRKFPEAQLGSLRLTHLVDQFGIEVDGTLHRALTDAKCLWKVIEHLAVGHYMGNSTATSKDHAPEASAKLSVNMAKSSVGHQAVVSLTGHTIEENMAEPRSEDEDTNAVENAGMSVTVQVSGLIDTGVLFEGDGELTQRILLAIETLRYAERVRAPENILRNALKSFLVTLRGIPSLSGNAHQLVDLLGQSLDWMSIENTAA